MERRLAAILVADVVGYSRLMEQDEVGTIAAWAERRKAILEPLLTKYHGRVTQFIGDCTLAEFASAVDAVKCAVDIQKAMRDANSALPEDRAIILRVGINLGDVIFEDNDLFGDGVNIAARLEAMADPGGICLSAAIHQQVERLLPFSFIDLGNRALKNIARPVRVYSIADNGAAESSSQTPPLISRATLEQNKPSIVVLPFVNMSGDPEQEYFSDGITEDIITDLSKISALNVLSRQTAFTLKGKAADIGQIARRLKVAYVIEGSVRKVGDRVRITAQLIDANTDTHVWGDRYDRDLNDIFALQDEIAQAIVVALKVKLLPAERKAIENRSTRYATAYQVYLQGRYHYLHFGVRNLEIATRFGQRALEIDPQYARAWVLIALCQSTLRIRGRSDESGLAAAEMALKLDPYLAEAHSARGRILCDLGRHDDAVAEFEESVRLDPDSPEVRFNFGQACFALGRYEAAIKHLEHAVTLSEESFDSLSYLAQIYEVLGRKSESSDAARRALAQIESRIESHPDDALSLSWGASLLVLLGYSERAKEWISRTLVIEPDDGVIQFNLAGSLAQMGEIDHALDLLERAARKMPALAAVSWMHNDTELAPLHGHARYKAILAREAARLAGAQTGQIAKSTT